MPSAYCHGCGREIVFAESEIGLRFQCASCGFVVQARPYRTAAVDSHTNTIRRPARPWLAPGAIAAGLVLALVAVCAGRTVLILVFSLARDRSQQGKVGGSKYPPPLTKCNGQTADQWGENAKDADLDRCNNATLNLKELKSEGVPYLLVAAEFHKDREENCGACLRALDGSLLEPEDVGRVVPFVGEKYHHPIDDAENPAGIPWFWVRGAAVDVLKQAGPKAKPYAKEIEKLRKHRNLKADAHRALSAMGQ